MLFFFWIHRENIPCVIPKWTCELDLDIYTQLHRLSVTVCTNSHMRLMLGGPRISTACTLHVCVHQHGCRMEDTCFKIHWNSEQWHQVLQDGMKIKLPRGVFFITSPLICEVSEDPTLIFHSLWLKAVFITSTNLTYGRHQPFHLAFYSWEWISLTADICCQWTWAAIYTQQLSYKVLSTAVQMSGDLKHMQIEGMLPAPKRY